MVGWPTRLGRSKEPAKLDPTLPAGLGAGERDAICLALEFKASLLLIDDLPGRLAAEKRNIQFTGTLAILFQAALISGLDYDLKLEELRLLGFRASGSVLKKMRERFESARRSGSPQK